MRYARKLTPFLQQIYIACIQLQVVGVGTVNLPSGAPDAATFPGAYK